MTRDYLEKNWALSSYEEDTNEQLDYYINERECNVGDKAYLYSHEDEELSEMEIVHIIRRSDDMELYDELDDEVLIDGEDKYDADTGAEFITNDDCFLVWFKFIEGNYMRVATEIMWETDGYDVILPTEIEIPKDIENDFISDYLSDVTGFLHNGYVLEYV